MSYQERRVGVTIFMGLLVLIAYGVYVSSQYQKGSINMNDLPAWGTIMLVFIGIGIIATIITQILFHVIYSIIISIKEKSINPDLTNEDLEKIIKHNMVTDEMDKLVELKSMRVGFIVSGIGFILGLLFILNGYSAVILINIMFLSFSLGSILDGVTQLFYYKKGIKHG
jgi:hypothetical protein